MRRLVATAKGRGIAVVAAMTLFATPLAAPAAGAQPTSESQPSRPDIEVRDQLIADQESLLNTYRCLFAVDVDVDPGGCANGKPAGGRTRPGTFDGTPTQADRDVRDQFIPDQETLLNTYRCQFDVDTQLVPGGCTNQPGPEPDGEPPSGAFTAISAGENYSCGIRADGTAVCWGANHNGQTDSPPGRFTALSAGRDHACAIRADHTAVCWDWTTSLPAGVSWRADPPDPTRSQRPQTI